MAKLVSTLAQVTLTKTISPVLTAAVHVLLALTHLLIALLAIAQAATLFTTLIQILQQEVVLSHAM